MDRQRRRAVLYLGLFASIVVVYTFAYDLGMTVFEGEDRTLLESLAIVIETFTTTGYGEDAGLWDSPGMESLMILMQVSGVLLFFTSLPLFVAPWLQETLRVTPPTSIDELSGHVVICGYSARAETLIDELDSWDEEYVVVESDSEVALELYREGTNVVHGDPEFAETLENAHVGAARTVVADASDEQNASIVLAVREVSDTVRVITLVEDPSLTTYLQYAGADRVVSPRHLLGRSLADKVSTSVTADLGETAEIGEDFEIVELSIQTGSEVAGKRLADSSIRERTGVNVIGTWSRGDFQSSPSPDTPLDRSTILIAAGRPDQLERLKEMTRSEQRTHDHRHVLVAGYGEVGSTVTDQLYAADAECRVVDREEKSGVDVVGDVTDEQTLVDAGIERASAVIFALSDDTSTIFATLVARKLSSTIEIVARANETESIGKLYNAGADYVLALETVSGRMLASTILEDEDVISPNKQVEIVRTTAPELAGQSLREADIRSRTGCTVIAVERNGDVLTKLDAEFRLRRDDRVIVAGTDDDTNEFAAIAN